MHDSESGAIVQFKSLTTVDPVGCAEICLKKAADHCDLRLEEFLSQVDPLFCFGTTIGLNTLLTRSGAKVGIITTRGHGDAYRIAEMNRGGVVDVRTALEATFQPLFGRRQIVEVTERLDYTGTVIVPLVEEELRAALHHLVDERGVDSLVVSFLWAQLNGIHEQRARAIAAELYPDLFVTLGADVSGSLGEFKRTSTAVINAYIGNAVQRQGTRLQDFLEDNGLRAPLLVMQTLGGVAPLSEVVRAPVMLINSGPAGGAVGALAVAKAINMRNVVCMDVGGTSCDISAITEQEIELSAGLKVLGHPIAVSGVEIVSIGAGGGSIATLERAGSMSRLRVGPESAGADPGPACYGRGGTRPTVTDANLVLGLFAEATKLGGEIELDDAAARLAIQSYASATGALEHVVEDAWGIYQVITAAMADAIENFLVAKGYDPRRYILVGFGAAAGVHAASIGSHLGSPQVLVPNFFPVFSAFGLMTTDIRHAYSLTDDTVKVTLGEQADETLDDKAVYVSQRLREVADFPMQLLETENVPLERRSVQLFVDLRYKGQVLELSIAIAPSVLETNLDGNDLATVVKDWLSKFKRVYGEAAAWTEGEIEVINYRAVGIGRIDSPQMPELPTFDLGASNAPRPTRKIYLGEWLEAEIWDATTLRPGMDVVGPALIEGELRTVLVGPGDRVAVDPHGNLLITPSSAWVSRSAQPSIIDNGGAHGR
ncbi:MAG: N-methylhydantoinase A [Gammaproteobacteria bacterium]